MNIYILSLLTLFCCTSTNLFCMEQVIHIDQDKELHEAVMYGDYRKFKNIIDEKKVDINNKEIWFEDTPLHEAISCGRLNMVNVLLKNGADINIQNSLGNTPLHVAMEKKSILILKKLMKYKPNLNIRDKEGYAAYQNLLHGQELDYPPTMRFIKSAHPLFLEACLEELIKEQKPQQSKLDFVPNQPNVLLILFLIRLIFSEHSQIEQFHKLILQNYVQLFGYPVLTSEFYAQVS